MKYSDKAKEIVSQLTVEEKAALCSGANYWQTKEIPRVGLPSMRMSDGPHGLRRQTETEGSPEGDSIPSTCFPTASAIACSFNRQLLQDIGVALGEECLQEGVDILLGPGVNMKRHPMCGRNFEYFSEDPVVAGELAAAMINGIQSQGVGTSLKHFAANNQESNRMTVSSVADERTLREIYLKAFEIAVKKSKPWSVMASYNRINGTYATEDRRLLTDILRKEWGFKGMVVSDWGACSKRVTGLWAGTDLEMPGPAPEHDGKIADEVHRGILPDRCLDRAAVRVAKLALRSADQKKSGEYHYDQTAHQKLARTAACESIVLLKNEDNILPIQTMKPSHPMKDGNAKDNIAIIGALAKHPHFQGAGSSRVHPSQVDNAYDELTKQGLNLLYASGYPHKADQNDPAKVRFTDYLDDARDAAGKCDIALVFVGLIDPMESEGYDRTDLDLPKIQNQLIAEVAKVQPNTVVIVEAGSPVLMPWASDVKAILMSYLSGQAGGGALADILTGKVNPSGKLAETFPLNLEDIPSANHFRTGDDTEEYRESLYIGYRYYDTARAKVLFPFGHGLSYTKFSYEDLRMNRTTLESGQNQFLTVTVTIRNIGETSGAETVQLYVKSPNSQKVFRPKMELRDFNKLYLAPGETKELTFELNDQSFSYYYVDPDGDTDHDGWAVESGEYQILLGASSQDIRLEATLTVTGDGKEKDLRLDAETIPAYYYPMPGGMDTPKKQFETLYGSRLPLPYKMSGTAFTVDDTVRDIEDTFVGKVMTRVIEKQFDKMSANIAPDDLLMIQTAMWQTPLRSLPMFAGGKIKHHHIEGVVEMANGHYLRGAKKLFRSKH
jgi:beta-glucosidase